MVMTNEHVVSLLGDKNVSALIVVMATQLSGMKTTAHLKWVTVWYINYISKILLGKTKNKSQGTPHHPPGIDVLQPLRMSY